MVAGQLPRPPISVVDHWCDDGRLLHLVTPLVGGLPTKRKDYGKLTGAPDDCITSLWLLVKLIHVKKCLLDISAARKVKSLNIVHSNKSGITSRVQVLSTNILILYRRYLYVMHEET